jgi:hypothetical protein
MAWRADAEWLTTGGAVRATEVTAREAEVLALIARHLTNAQITAALFISTHRRVAARVETRAVSGGVDFVTNNELRSVLGTTSATPEQVEWAVTINESEARPPRHLGRRERA